MASVIVVGAGISGLAIAFRLSQLRPDLDIRVLESDSRPGGKVWTEHEGKFVVEHGPNGFLETKPSTLQLGRDVGLGDELIAASDASRKHRFLFLNNRLQSLPSGPMGLLTTGLLSWRGKLALMGELYRPRRQPVGDETVASFFRRRLGREAADTLGDALVTGIHGGDPEMLSMAAAFPRVAEMEAAHGSVIRGFMRTAKQRRRDAAARGEPPPRSGRMWSFNGGLRRLVEALTERLPQPPVFSVNVRRIEESPGGWIVRGDGNDAWPADAVVLACPAYQQARIVADLDPALAIELSSIAYNRLAVVAVGFREADVPKVPAGFGYIAPQRTLRDILGVQWCSAIYPGRAPQGCVLWRVLCGGWHRADVVDWPDDRLLAAVREELKLALGVTQAPNFHRIVRWGQAIPQYHVGHRERVARAEMRAGTHPGLYLAGNALHGVALNDCTERGALVARRIADELRATRVNPDP